MKMSEQFRTYKQLLSGGAIVYEPCIFCECDDSDLLVIGGTREQTFNLPFSNKLIEKLLVVYVQDDAIILKKTKEDFKIAEFDESLIYLNLDEQETFKFNEGPAKAQMKVLLEDGSIIISDVFHLNCVKPEGNSLFVESTPLIYSLQADVRGNDVKLIELQTISAGNTNNIVCKFTFDTSWDDYSKKIIFTDMYNHRIEVNLGDNIYCVVPNEILGRPGKIYVGVIGTYTWLQKTTEWSNSIRVHDSCNLVDYNDRKVDPSDIPYADENTAGIMKLYHTRGDNTDGSITQKKITQGFDSIKIRTDDIDDECMVFDVDF